MVVAVEKAQRPHPVRRRRSLRPGNRMYGLKMRYVDRGHVQPALEAGMFTGHGDHVLEVIDGRHDGGPGNLAHVHPPTDRTACYEILTGTASRTRAGSAVGQNDRCVVRHVRTGCQGTVFECWGRASARADQSPEHAGPLLYWWVQLPRAILLTTPGHVIHQIVDVVCSLFAERKSDCPLRFLSSCCALQLERRYERQVVRGHARQCAAMNAQLFQDVARMRPHAV